MPPERRAIRTAPVVERRPVAAPQHRRTSSSPSPSRTLRRRLDAQNVVIARAVEDSRLQRVTQPAPLSAQASKATRLPAKVSKPSDPAELEAEEIARKVARMTAPPAVVATAGKRTGKDVAHRADTGSTSTRTSPPSAGGGGGAPLPAPVRRFMEPRFGADFGNVRIHTGASAARDSAALSARAFTVGQHIYFGRDAFQPQSASGRELIAHELAHTIQQGTTVQRSVDTTVRQRSSGVQRLGVRDWIADAANNVPGFRILCLVLGFNPINNAAVDRTPANFVRGVVELMPGGKYIADALANHGILDRVATWLEGKLADLRGIGGALRQSIGHFIDERGLGDVGRMGEVWESAKRLFTQPAERLKAFVISLASDVFQFIRQAILLPLARLAEGTDGYDLLKAVLGEDPVTKERVVPSAENLIGGFMKLIQQQEVWDNIKKANAIPRAWAWFQQAVGGARALVARIPTMFIETLQALDVSDLVLVPRAFGKVVGLFGRFLGDFAKWAGNSVLKLLEIIFEVVSPATLTYLRRTGEALWSILKNPLPFMRNLIRVAITGFQSFADHFGTHLKAGLIEWLTGALPGVYVPKSFALGEIVKFVFSVLGLTWQNLRGKLVKVVGETPVKAMETGFDIVVVLVREGPAAAWEKIKEELATLKDTVIGGIMDLVIDTVVKKAIPKLLAMFIPGAGFVQAIMSIYDTIMVFVQKLSRIAQVVRGFVDSIVAIAGGAIDAAAKRVEDSLAGILSLAINFLAGFFGAGNIASKVMGVITKIRASVDKALDKFVDWIRKGASTFIGAAKSGVKKLVGWLTREARFADDTGARHRLFFRGALKNAKLRVASDEKDLAAFLKSVTVTDKNKKTIDVITTANAAVTDLLQRRKPPTPDGEDPQIDPKIVAAFDTIAQNLPLLFSGDEWGTETNPVLIVYPKKAASLYRTLYLGPLVEGRITQSLLQSRFSATPGKAKPGFDKNKPIKPNGAALDAWIANGGQVLAFTPFARAAWPDGKSHGGSGQLGLAEQFLTQPGVAFTYNKGKTPGGRILNDALKKFGYYGRSQGGESSDGDHVLEAQLIGTAEANVIPNMWPLDKTENRHGKNLEESADLEIPGRTDLNAQLKGKGLLAAAGSKDKKKSKKPLRVMIKSTK